MREGNTNVTVIPSVDVTVAIPAHEPRLKNGMLARALESVAAQLHPPAAISVAIDYNHAGAPHTRQRALDAVTTPWVAFLDSDDTLDPEHLELLAGCANREGADYVFSYFHGADVLGSFGKEFDPEHPHETTITTLVRTELAKSVGFQALTDRSANTGEDAFFTRGCVARGAKIVHLPIRTWTYTMGEHNTSGLGSRW